MGGDGNCDDENNNKGCEYDGGDCCAKTVDGYEVSKKYCSKCECVDPDNQGSKDYGGKGDYGGYGKRRRQLDGHEKKKEDTQDKYAYKKDMEKKEEDMKDKYADKKEGDKKDMDKKDKEPSAELKAAMKACTENKLCKELMECKKKHMESGGKGDGKGKGDHEEVCVEEMKACAADKTCSMLHEKLQAAMKK